MRSAWLAFGLVPFTALALRVMPEQPRDVRIAKFQPGIFGTFKGNVGCVILKQQPAVKKKGLDTGTILAAGKYEVVETFHHEMTQTEFQGQKGADELNRIGQEERIKFVVVPERYTMDQLNVARDECQKNLVVQPEPPAATVEIRETVSSETSAAAGITAPECVYQPYPVYTPEAKKAGIEGTVTLLIVVDAAGNVSDVEVAERLGYGLDERASNAVKSWKFKPALKDGKPVPVKVTVIVSFKLLRLAEPQSVI